MTSTESCLLGQTEVEDKSFSCFFFDEAFLSSLTLFDCAVYSLYDVCLLYIYVPACVFDCSLIPRHYSLTKIKIHVLKIFVYFSGHWILFLNFCLLFSIQSDPNICRARWYWWVRIRRASTGGPEVNCPAMLISARRGCWRGRCWTEETSGARLEVMEVTRWVLM